MSDANKKFQETYDDLKVPSDLKAQTLAMMLKEDANLLREQETSTQKESKISNGKMKKSNSSKRFHYTRYGAVLLTACAAVLCFVIFMPHGAPYITKLEDGTYYETVELKDGKINFMQNRMAISITPNAGLAIGSDIEAAEEKEEVLLLEKESKSGGKLRFLETTKVTLPNMSQSGWSHIGEQEIYVTVLKTEEIRYQAVYEKDGIIYEVIGIDVTQKEFIDFLYEQVK